MTDRPWLAHYDAGVPHVIDVELGLDANPAAGQVLHLEGPMDGGGMRVVDIWESPEAFQTFVQERLGPAFQRAGAILPADMQPKAVWPVTGLFMAK